MLNGPNVDPIQLTVNPDGTFEIAQALPGTYQLRLNDTVYDIAVIGYTSRYR